MDLLRNELIKKRRKRKRLEVSYMFSFLNLSSAISITYCELRSDKKLSFFIKITILLVILTLSLIFSAAVQEFPVSFTNLPQSKVKSSNPKVIMKLNAASSNKLTGNTPVHVGQCLRAVMTRFNVR